jgi:hypothetical protein
MRITTKGIEGNPELAERIEAANQILQEIAGQSPSLAAADWELDNRSDPPRLRLALSDHMGASEEVKFGPSELDYEERLRARLYKVWGDVLQKRSHQQLNQLSGRIDMGR